MSVIEDLIAAVEKHPCIWDINHENYTNKVQRDLAIEEVCKSVISNWNDLSPAEQKKICNIKRKQWNNVRDGYRKYLNRIKNTPIESGVAGSKKYTYANNLHFLTPILRNCRRREGLDGSSQGPPQDLNQGTQYQVSEQQARTDQDYEMDENERNRHRKGQKRKCTKRSRNNKKSKKSEMLSQILDIIKLEMNHELSYHDDDCQFLLSFRSNIKAMSDYQKIQFKIGTLQLVQDILFNE